MGELRLSQDPRTQRERKQVTPTPEIEADFYWNREGKRGTLAERGLGTRGKRSLRPESWRLRQLGQPPMGPGQLCRVGERYSLGLTRSYLCSLGFRNSQWTWSSLNSWNAWCACTGENGGGATGPGTSTGAASNFGGVTGPLKNVMKILALLSRKECPHTHIQL